MRTRSKIGGALAACCAVGALAAAGSAHATATVLTSGSFDPTPNQIYTLTPSDVMPGVTSSAKDTMNVPGGTTETYDFKFSIDQTYGTTAFGSFGFDDAGSAVTDANLQLFAGTPNKPGTFITGLDYNPSTDPQQSLQANLNGGNYFVQTRITTPAGSSVPVTLSATVHAISAAPEPSTWLLMMGGVSGLGMALRLQRRRAQAVFVA